MRHAGREEVTLRRWDALSRDPMRVLLLTESFPTRAHPGRGIFLAEQARALSHSHVVDVLFPQPFFPGVPSRWLEPRARQVDVAGDRMTLDGPKPLRPRYFYLPRMRRVRARALGSLAARELAGAKPRYDLIHAHWLSPPGLAAVRAARMAGIPAVVTAHAGDVYRDLENPRFRRLAEEVVRLASVVIAVAEYFRDPLLGLGLDPERLEIIPNGVDTSIFHPMDQAEARRSLGLPLAGPLYLYIGNLVPAKGVTDLVEAFFSHAPAEAHLVLAGTGPLAEVLRIRAQRSRGRMVVRGLQAHAAVARYLAAADAFLLPSYGEGNPVTVLESLCVGRPVIGSSIPALQSLIQDGRNGFLVAPGDRARLGQAMCQLPETSWDFARIAQSAENRFGWPVIVRAIGAAYEKACAHDGKLRPPARSQPGGPSQTNAFYQLLSGEMQ